jgi:hypothetical protein
MLYPLRKVSNTIWMWELENPEASMDALERRKSLCREWNTDHPARSPSVYKLLYPGEFTRQSENWHYTSEIGQTERQCNLTWTDNVMQESIRTEAFPSVNTHSYAKKGFIMCSLLHIIMVLKSAHIKWPIPVLRERWESHMKLCGNLQQEEWTCGHNYAYIWKEIIKMDPK